MSIRLSKTSHTVRNTPIIEPYYLLDLKKTGRRLYLGAGFASGDSRQYNDFNPSQAFRGTYLRAAYEVRRLRSTRRILYAGYGPVISIVGYNGKFHFEGPTFGDYEGRFKETNNIAFGIEGYFGFDFSLANHWLLRLTFRNVMGRRTAADTRVQYFPGFGYTIEGLNNRLLYSGGLSLQIHYKIR